jgi:hypothetical protein
MNRTSNLQLVVLISVTLGTTGTVLGQDTAAPNQSLEAIERQLETSRHESLLTRIAEIDTELAEFSTDGCSGGLSVGWAELSDRFPAFAARLGGEPSWEACCVAHDRDYHGGGAEANSASDSFDQRRDADLELASCVVDTGVQQSPALQELYGLSETQVGILYEAIAELMHRAVRLGGIPCTTQAWRWGYGWPLCR